MSMQNNNKTRSGKAPVQLVHALPTLPTGDGGLAFHGATRGAESTALLAQPAPTAWAPPPGGFLHPL